MNTIITSKEQILKAAFLIAKEKGISKINIRQVAQACGVSIGSIYNYYPTKAELVFAVIEAFWYEAFHGVSWEDLEKRSFPDFFEALYHRFYCRLSAFQSEWAEGLSSLSQQEKKLGKKLEADYFSHIQKGLLWALEQDRSIPVELWAGPFQKEAFAEFVFRNMMGLLQEGKEDCAFFRAALERLLSSK